MFLNLGKPIIHDGRSFSHTVPVALKSDQVTSAQIKHGMVVGEEYFRAGPKPVETFRPNRPGASRVTQKPVALPSGAAAEMTRRLTRLKVAIEDDLTNL